jgi:hypothetical protein
VDRARQIQLEIFRRMTPGERWKVACSLYWSARRLKAAHLRQQHPDWSEERVALEVKTAFMHVRG